MKEAVDDDDKWDNGHQWNMKLLSLIFLAYGSFSVVIGSNGCRENTDCMIGTVCSIVRGRG